MTYQHGYLGGCRGYSAVGGDLFTVDQKKIKGAIWNYLKENKDYLYYMIKEWISRLEADSVGRLKRGEGMITGSRGKKPAVFRV